MKFINRDRNCSCALHARSQVAITASKGARRSLKKKTTRNYEENKRVVLFVLFFSSDRSQHRQKPGEGGRRARHRHARAHSTDLKARAPQPVIITEQLQHPDQRSHRYGFINTRLPRSVVCDKNMQSVELTPLINTQQHAVMERQDSWSRDEHMIISSMLTPTVVNVVITLLNEHLRRFINTLDYWMGPQCWNELTVFRSAEWIHPGFNQHL